MEMKERFEDKVVEVATKILVADINNGLRNYWIYDMSDTKVDKLINQSVAMAKILVGKVMKNDSPQ